MAGASATADKPRERTVFEKTFPTYNLSNINEGIQFRTRDVNGVNIDDGASVKCGHPVLAYINAFRASRGLANFTTDDIVAGTIHVSYHSDVVRDVLEELRGRLVCIKAEGADV